MSKNVKAKKERTPPTEGQQIAAFMGGCLTGLLIFMAGVGYLISQAPA